MKIILLGIGQTMRGDDGLGPAAVRQWTRAYPEMARDPAILVAEAATPGMEILSLLEDVDAGIIVDAMQSGLPVGSIRIYDPIPSSGAVPESGKTAHGFGVVETIALAREIHQSLPARIILLGIEAGQFVIGQGLSEETEAILPEAAREIQKLIQFLMGNSLPKPKKN
jgi:hydrogenase maturation protease